MTQTFTRDEVARHNSEEDLWLIIDSQVYDVTDFVDAHPGGLHVLREVAGHDCTRDFYSLHRQEVLRKYDDLRIGMIRGERTQIIFPKAGDLSGVPYGEPTWLTGEYSSPYFGPSHRRLRKAMREFTETHLFPHGPAAAQTGEPISRDLIRRMDETGVTRMRMGPGKHLEGFQLLGGVVEPSEFDSFHDLIVVQELARGGVREFQDGNLSGLLISMPIILNYARDERWKTKIVSQCMSGEKRICLAITEPWAGSDVAGLRTTAKRTEDGKHYMVSGTKKWITNGTWCDYFVTAVKTPKGLSVLLIERGPGVETKPIKTSYSSHAPGTSLVTFTDVKVPVENRLGEEGNGLRIVLSNFNHERWTMAASIIRTSRLITEECIKWSNQRVIFGKPLIEQPVIRQKLAKMIAHCEANQAWLENVTYQMTTMTYEQWNKQLAGPISLLKMFATRSAHEIADESVQIFGGRGITATGMGRLVENFHRTYKVDAVPGGSEEVLADLGVRQAMKSMPKAML